MRLFIKDYNNKKLSDFTGLLDKYYNTSENYVDIYSKDGIYRINQKDCLKINTIDKEIHTINNYYKNETIMIDYSIFLTEQVYQIPSEHISIPIKKYNYSLNKNSKIKLIIEHINIDKSHQTFFTNGNITNSIYFYFEIPDELDINNNIVKEELFVFLSLLN
jgi:hypothetical protein